MKTENKPGRVYQAICRIAEVIDAEFDDLTVPERYYLLSHLALMQVRPLSDPKS